MATRYVDQYGLEHYHELIKNELVTATQAGATAAWTGAVDASALAPGKTIIYTLPNGSAAGTATLNLTLPSGETTGAKPVLDSRGEAVTDAYQAGCDLLMVYDGTSWRVLNDPDSYDKIGRRIYKAAQTFTSGTVTGATFAPTGYTYKAGDEDLIEVYMNGLKMTAAEYTAAQSGAGMEITLTTSITAGGDTIEMVLRK